MDILDEIAVLTPLTSSKGVFQDTEVRRQAFEKIKTLMTHKPLFKYLITPQAEKIIQQV
jgi:hypothetical protein